MRSQYRHIYNLQPLLSIWTLAVIAVTVAACTSSSPTPVPAATETNVDTDDGSEATIGHDLLVAKGCAACHGQNGEGSAIAPPLAGHTEAQVKRQVRSPRFQMPAFSEEQVSDEELDAIIHYIAGLESEGHAHAEVENAQLSVIVEMHHWMALEALKADVIEDAIHHVEHIIELLDAGEHQDRMKVIQEDLQVRNIHDAEHNIEEMLTGNAAPDLTLAQLHLRQALVALAVEGLADAKHHVEHLQELAGALEDQKVAEIIELLGKGDLHQAEHEIQELLGEEHSD